MHNALEREDVLIDSSLVFERAPEIDFRNDVDEEHWTQKFYDPFGDKYDWEDPEWLKQNEGPLGFLPIYLTQGYFMIVLRKDYEFMTKHTDGRPKSWKVHIERDEDGTILKIYGRRGGLSTLNEIPEIYAHREVMGCLYAGGKVDHVNGCGLDNRGKIDKKKSVNLRIGSRANSHNVKKTRTVHMDITLSGIVKAGKNKKGEQRYIAQVCKRVGEQVVTFRSKMHWIRPELANRWYRNKLKELNNGREEWVHALGTVNIPKLPPLKKHDIPF